MAALERGVGCFREDVYLESHLVERISIEFNQLQFYVSKSRGQALVEQVKPVGDMCAHTIQSIIDIDLRLR